MFTISVFYTSIIGLQPPRNRKRNLINFIAGLFLILSLGLFQLPTLAQIDLAIIQEIIDGDQVFIQENQAKVEDKEMEENENTSGEDKDKEKGEHKSEE